MLLVASATSTPVWAQSYPARSVLMIMGVTPGSAPDGAARLVGAQLEKQFGQTFLADNRAGANGTIAAKAVIAAAPDGYTLFFGSGTTISPVFLKANSVNANSALAPVSKEFTAPYT